MAAPIPPPLKVRVPLGISKKKTSAVFVKSIVDTEKPTPVSAAGDVTTPGSVLLIQHHH